MRCLQIERELERRRCRRSLLAFAIKALGPMGHVPARHHRLMLDELEKVIVGKYDRIMFFLPPGSAKSTYISQIFPAYWFGKFPQSAVIAASNTSELAESFGRKVRNLVEREKDILQFGLEVDARAAAKWITTRGGEYYSVGINGGSGSCVTGRRADLIIIDDPVKSKLEADNQDIQKKVMDYYRTELYTRLKPGGRIIIVQTRWAERDLSGQLLDEMSNGGDQWRIISLSAIAEDPALSTEDYVIEPDPLGRKPGEALWPEWEDIEALERKKNTLGPVDWAGLFQQHPKPPQGVLFDVDKIQTTRLPPPTGTIIRAWDLAATKEHGGNDPDWTVGVKLMRTSDDHYIVLDVVRARLGPMEVCDLVMATAALDGRKVRIRMAEDCGQAGKQQSAFYAGKLSSYQLTFDKETGDKETRATACVVQVNTGNFSMVEAKWNRAFISELRDFPNGRHDDQVDALSGAFGVIGLRPPPIHISLQAQKRLGMIGRRQAETRVE